MFKGFRSCRLPTPVLYHEAWIGYGNVPRSSSLYFLSWRTPIVCLLLVRETAASSSEVVGAELIRFCFAQMRVIDEEPSSVCDVHHS